MSAEWSDSLGHRLALIVTAEIVLRTLVSQLYLSQNAHQAHLIRVEDLVNHRLDPQRNARVSTKSSLGQERSNAPNSSPRIPDSASYGCTQSPSPLQVAIQAQVAPH